MCFKVLFYAKKILLSEKNGTEGQRVLRGAIKPH